MLFYYEVCKVFGHFKFKISLQDEFFLLEKLRGKALTDILDISEETGKDFFMIQNSTTDLLLKNYQKYLI